MSGRSRVGNGSRRGSRRVITEKQRKFVQGVAAGKSDRAAALEAGYSDQVSRNTRCKLWSRPRVQEYFQKLMMSAAPPSRVVRKISQNIDAREVSTRIRRRLGPPDKDGKKRVLEEVVERTEGVNAAVSLRACQLAIEAAGYTPERGPEIQISQVTQMQVASDDEILIRKLLGDDWR